MNDPFVPFGAPKVRTAATPAQTFQARIVPNATTAVPFRPAGAAVEPNTSQAGAGVQEPRVTLRRHEERITHIEIHCGCGRHIELECQY